MTFEEVKINEGEFLLVLGPSAGGKTTFLKQLKKKFEQQGFRTGYVMQNFDAQIVTDKVWHELCFALENLGTAPSVMHRRVAEVCSYFGIGEWLNNDTAYLSGGQKQLVNLAAVMAMTPDVLLLDEPTSQLDPVTAQNFLATVRRLNLELGVTVIIVEHRIEELFSVSDRVLYIDKMNALFSGTPEELVLEKTIIEFLPCASRIAINSGFSQSKKIPLTVREGRTWLRERLRDSRGAERPDLTNADTDGAIAQPRIARPLATGSAGAKGKLQKQKIIECKNLSFAYEKGKDVLCQLNFTLNKGEIFAGVGANGSGKSTFLKLLCSLVKPTGGKIIIDKNSKVFLMSQNVRNIFTRQTACDELIECGYKKGEKLSVLSEGLLNRHPYDLSGGEMQKLALEKILLRKPDIILLDEPTKGLDNAFKKEFSSILKNLSDSGVSIVLVCHDLEFCAYTADRVGMIFEGTITESSVPEEFFSGNNFYTTSVNRICRGIINGAVKEEDIKW